jgi:hypothetical protein
MVLLQITLAEIHTSVVLLRLFQEMWLDLPSNLRSSSRKLVYLSICKIMSKLQLCTHAQSYFLAWKSSIIGINSKVLPLVGSCRLRGVFDHLDRGEALLDNDWHLFFWAFSKILFKGLLFLIWLFNDLLSVWRLTTRGIDGLLVTIQINWLCQGVIHSLGPTFIRVLINKINSDLFVTLQIERCYLGVISVFILFLWLVACCQWTCDYHWTVFFANIPAQLFLWINFLSHKVVLLLIIWLNLIY